MSGDSQIPTSGEGPSASRAAKSPPPQVSIETEGEMHVLLLVKNEQRFVFRYPPGGEAQLLEGLAAMAADPEHELSWFDAALMSHQLGQRISKQLKEQSRAS